MTTLFPEPDKPVTIKTLGRLLFDIGRLALQGHLLFVALYEFLSGINAALLQNVIARRRFDQHRKVTADRDRQHNFGESDAHDSLCRRVHR